MGTNHTSGTTEARVIKFCIRERSTFGTWKIRGWHINHSGSEFAGERDHSPHADHPGQRTYSTLCQFVNGQYAVSARRNKRPLWNAVHILVATQHIRLRKVLVFMHHGTAVRDIDKKTNLHDHPMSHHDGSGMVLMLLNSQRCPLLYIAYIIRPYHTHSTDATNCDRRHT